MIEVHFAHMPSFELVNNQSPALVPCCGIYSWVFSDSKRSFQIFVAPEFFFIIYHLCIPSTLASYLEGFFHMKASSILGTIC